jgi:hypothetical protein
MGRKRAHRYTNDTSGLPDHTNGSAERNPRWHRSHRRRQRHRMRARTSHIHTNHIRNYNCHWMRNRDHSNLCRLLYTLNPLRPRLHPNHILANSHHPIPRLRPSQACYRVCQADRCRACCQACRVDPCQAAQAGRSQAGLRSDSKLARKIQHSRHGSLRTNPC